MEYSKIKSIESVETKPIYHLTVEKNHNFFGNNLCLHNCGYRGEIKFRFKKLDWDSGEVYNVGDKIGQLIIIPYPTIELEEVSELSETNRGSNGFGSTGN